MDEQIQLPAEDLPHLGGDSRAVGVGADVACGNQRRIDRGRELANVALDPFPLVGEGEPGAAIGETLRDRPGDRALVGDAEDEAALAGEISHGGRVYGFSATLRGLRRAALLPLAAALILASAASATLQPIRRSYGEFSLPRVRAGTLKIPAASSRGRLTVLVGLRLPPLAAYNRNLFSAVSTSRLNVRSSSSRAYLARLAHAQSAAAAELERAIPSARISYRYRVVLDGFAVSLPARKLPALARLHAVTKIYPSVRYALDTNQSPAIIGADQMWATTGDRGDGIKIGVVDDGIDQANPFFSPTGFSYPAGFPRGQTRFTTPKVIVARSFPGPGSGAQGKLPLYRQGSFHGTHVAGIAAGDAGTTAPAGPDHPTVTGLSGVAPRAWLGNYRVFNTPTPTGYDAFPPQIVAAFESAVTDGMDVINFSGGGPQVDPISDALVEAVRNVANPGVVPVIAAGSARHDWGLGFVRCPGTAPFAVSLAPAPHSDACA